MSKQFVIDQLNNASTLRYYTIGEERHENGEKHFHVVIEAFVKFNRKDKEKLDLKFEDSIFTGHYEPVKNIVKALKYVTEKLVFFNFIFFSRKTKTPLLLIIGCFIFHIFENLIPQ